MWTKAELRCQKWGLSLGLTRKAVKNEAMPEPMFGSKRINLRVHTQL